MQQEMAISHRCGADVTEVVQRLGPTLRGCCNAFSLSTTAARWPRLLATCSVLSILRPFLRHRSRTCEGQQRHELVRGWARGPSIASSRDWFRQGSRTAVCTAAYLQA